MPKLLFLLLFSLTSFSSIDCLRVLPQLQEARYAFPTERYQKDTLLSLEQMRGKNGLVRDAVWIKKEANNNFNVVPLNSKAAPTNIALDLLIQAEMTSNPRSKPNALRNIKKVLSTLQKLSFHKQTGLFYREYETSGYKVENKDISAIDNLHLALALWTVSEVFPNTQNGKLAKELFNRMDFSCFTDKSTALLHGNLVYKNGTWEAEAYHFGNLGSEARSFYSLGWALGLFRSAPMKNFPANAVSSLTAETKLWNDGKSNRKLLRVWDGGAFQLLLPNLLIGENKISTELNERFKSYSDYILSEGKRRHLPLPAGHSASATGINLTKKSGPDLDYSGKLGSVDLVSLGNGEVNHTNLKEEWDSVITPHAVILAAALSPQKFTEPLHKAESLESNGQRLYQPGFGWMDGYGIGKRNTGQVVPVQLALNQGMIELALLQMASQDGKTLSARALQNNPVVFSRLKQFYSEVDKKLSKDK